MLMSFSLPDLGWNAYFSQQVSLDDLDSHDPARIAVVHRSGAAAWCERGLIELTIPRGMQREGVGAVLTVGDWVLAARDAPRIVRRLERLSAIVRIAAGRDGRPQAIAANVDTLFVVTSCNADFNTSRLERYMALAYDAGTTPVVVLTKADLCENSMRYIERARRSAPNAEIVALNATEPSSAALLERWLEHGRTVAFVGSSGVGKSTLVNTLAGAARQSTAAIREHDARGRHTTTARELIPIPGGAWLIDTPGMRELRIGAVESGVSETFSDVAALARSCRFRDCRHDGDAGCALAAAAADGGLDPRRLASFLKLEREAARASRTLHERREADRHLGKLYKSVLKGKRDERG
jgi:ribosome biogenesis GTPase / thiamine phosphate phosphatase